MLPAVHVGISGEFYFGASGEYSPGIDKGSSVEGVRPARAALLQIVHRVVQVSPNNTDPRRIHHAGESFCDEMYRIEPRPFSVLLQLDR